MADAHKDDTVDETCAKTEEFPVWLSPEAGLRGRAADASVAACFEVDEALKKSKEKPEANPKNRDPEPGNQTSNPKPYITNPYTP